MVMVIENRLVLCVVDGRTSIKLSWQRLGAGFSVTRLQFNDSSSLSGVDDTALPADITKFDEVYIQN